MLELITQSADDQMSILKAQWTADVAYLQLWGGYLGAMEVGWSEELCIGLHQVVNFAQTSIALHFVPPFTHLPR